MKSRRRETTLADIHARCVRVGDCLLWTGTTQAKNGAPSIYADGRMQSGRPLVWRLLGREPVRLITTLCGNAECLAADHLVPLAGPRARPAALAKKPAARPSEAPAFRAEPFPPNSPESFAVCDAVRREICGPDKPGMNRPWLIGRSA